VFQILRRNETTLKNIVKDSIKDGYPDALPKMPKGRGATKKL